jgi:heme A synthase
MLWRDHAVTASSRPGYGISPIRSVFRSLTSVLFVAVVIQVGLAGYGIFDAIHKAKTAPLTQKALEDDIGAHGVFGYIVLLLMLLLLVVALAGRLGSSATRWSGGIFLLGVLQAILGASSTSAPALGVLHGINALAIYAGAALLAHRTWSEHRAGAGTGTGAPAPEAAEV